MPTNAEKVLELAREKGILRSRDLDQLGIPRMTLTRLVRSGQLQRLARGLYMHPATELTEHHSLAEACKRIPHGVICLLSALRFHEMTTQAPYEVWMAIDRKARKPQIESLPLRIVRFPSLALRLGVERHEIEGVDVAVTSPARTVADCFRYRGKVGLDVAVEALRDYRRMRAGTIDELWEAAGQRRVRTVIRPYLEIMS